MDVQPGKQTGVEKELEQTLFTMPCWLPEGELEVDIRMQCVVFYFAKCTYISVKF